MFTEDFFVNASATDNQNQIAPAAFCITCTSCQGCKSCTGCKGDKYN